MRQRHVNIFACLLILLIIVGCTKTKDETYLRFEVEGKEYRITGVGFFYSKLPTSGRFHFMIDSLPQSNQRAPRGQIQWIMPANRLEELQGTLIDLSAVAREAKAGQYADPNVLFTLEKEDVSVSPSLTGDVNNLTVQIGSVDSNYIQGSFSGSGFDYLSVSDKISKSVNVSGDFRAKLYHQEP